MPRHEEPPATRGSTIRRWAPLYDWVVRILSLGRRDTLRTEVITAAAIEPGQRVLDVGCGTGTLALAIKRAVGEDGRVAGIDASPEMIGVARKKAHKQQVDVEFRSAAAEALPYPDASFDRVTSTLLFHHLPEDLRLDSLREIHRVLRPGGRLVVADFRAGAGPLPHQLFARLLGLFGHAHQHTHGAATSLVDLAHTAGFHAATTTRTENASIELTRATRD